jgi:hypothetical protein
MISGERETGCSRSGAGPGFRGRAKKRGVH